jgi:hypothetical protein
MSSAVRQPRPPARTCCFPHRPAPAAHLSTILGLHLLALSAAHTLPIEQLVGLTDLGMQDKCRALSPEP